MVIALSTLMVVLDSSIVTIALPSAQVDLGIADADRQWAITAYALAFGGLLLLGGRIADFTGRKRIFLVGMVGFAVASALGGLASEPWMLFASRGLQGAFAALLAPAALSLLVVTFTDARERAKAFGVYGAVQGAGGAIGLLLGGLLTEYVNWRWTLLVNVPLAALVLIAGVVFLRESRAEGDRRYDVPGAVLVTGALTALVYAFTLAATPGVGWLAPITISLLAIGLVLLLAFVVVERRVSHPLLPLRILLDRNRGGALLAAVLIFGSMFGLFLFLTYYLQGDLGYSPIQAGLAFLPFSAGVILTSTLAGRLLPRVGPRLLIIVGSALGAAGLLLLLRVGTDSTYAAGVLPALVVMGIGLGTTFVPLSVLAMHGVEAHDAGVAGAMVNVTQQVGGALGTAILNAVYLSVLTSQPAASSGDLLQSHLVAYHAAFAVSAALVVAALLVAVFLVRSARSMRVR